MRWMGSARSGRMLILKVHFKSSTSILGASVRSSAIRFTSAAVCCHPHGGKTKDMSGDAARHAVGEPPRRVSLASSLISSACAPLERAPPGGGCVQKHKDRDQDPKAESLYVVQPRRISPLTEPENPVRITQATSEGGLIYLNQGGRRWLWRLRG